MPLLERVRVEAYVPDLPADAYRNLLLSFEDEFTYAFIKLTRSGVFTEPVNEYEAAWKSYQATLKKEEGLKAACLEEKRQSPEFKLHLESLYLADDNDATNLNPQSDISEQRDLDDKHVKKCHACGGTVYDCWKCGGRGWIEES